MSGEAGPTGSRQEPEQGLKEASADIARSVRADVELSGLVGRLFGAGRALAGQDATSADRCPDKVAVNRSEWQGKKVG